MSITLIFLVLISATPYLSVSQTLPPKCDDRHFLCDNKTCIRSDLKCNGARDCPDGSDEDFVKCRTKKCAHDQFQCTYGGCVRKNATCDGVRDCDDSSDELLPKCRNEITDDECIANMINSSFTALDRYNECIRKQESCKNGQYISILEKCNGKVDCEDGSDETLETCASKKCFQGIGFKCKYGGCISLVLKCDGVINCVDGSDELDELCYTSNNDTCQLPPYPLNGYYIAVGPHSFPGQSFESLSLNYYCHSRYKLVGETSLYCNKGMWSGPVPECVSQCWLSKHPSVDYWCLPQNFSSQEDAKECGNLVDAGTVVRPKCRQPNYYSSGMLVNMHCTDGVWDRVTVCSLQCGVVTPLWVQNTFRQTHLNGLPWHAGIYTKTTTPYKQICGGSLVSSTVVISAAHCFFTNLDKQLPASRFAIAVGKFYKPWNSIRDQHAQKSDVFAINIPPRFQGDAANFQEDIAIVIVTDPFEFSMYVQPVCLDFDYNFNRRQLVTGTLGWLAGWRYNSSTLRVVQLPVVSTEQCISTAPLNFVSYITGDKFCAGYIHGTSSVAICSGESGGGLSFTYFEGGTERYYLRGLASTAPTNEDLGFCNTEFYTTFTDISKHENFIKDIIFSLENN